MNLTRMLPALLSLASASSASPMTQPEVFAPGVISGDQYDSHPALSPDGKMLLFVRSDSNFSNWHIWQSERTRHGWSAPHPATFATKTVDADPFFAPGGRQVYFISARADSGKPSHDLDIWVVDRTADGWGAPQRLPSPINSPGNEWFPRLQRDGTLYFGSDRPGGLGATDIYRATKKDGKWEALNLGAPVNSKGDEYEFEVSQDGSFAILMADRPPSNNGDLYAVRAAKKVWSTPRKLGPAINTDALEVGPFLSPGGKYLYFSSRRSETRLGDIYRARMSSLRPE